MHHLIKGVPNEIYNIFQTVSEEHKSISLLVESIRTKADFEDKLYRFAIVLEKHIKLKDRILFLKIKDCLSKDAIMILAVDLEENGYLNKILDRKMILN